MGKFKFLVLAVCLLVVTSCSKKKSVDDGLGDGNVPIARPGSELADVHFAYDSSNLDSSAKETLNRNSQWLLDNPSKKITVEGHCDERGTSEYNMALGLKRAESVYQFLRSQGVKESQLSFVSYGEEVPLDPASNESAWAKNRRAHFSMR